MALDGETLWAAVYSMRPYLGPEDVSIAFSNNETIWVASVQLTIGLD